MAVGQARVTPAGDLGGPCRWGEPQEPGKDNHHERNPTKHRRHLGVVQGRIVNRAKGGGRHCRVDQKPRHHSAEKSKTAAARVGRRLMGVGGEPQNGDETYGNEAMEDLVRR